MTEFKVGDEIQFNEDAVREADRIDKAEYGGTKGYAEGIIRKGGLESGGVIERNDYSDEAPLQIKLPNGSKCWAEEQWLKPKVKTMYVKINYGVETHSGGHLEAGKVYPVHERYEDTGAVEITDADGVEFYFGAHEVTEVILADWEYELLWSEGEHGVADPEPEPAPDKFQPGDKVDWTEADKYWLGVEVIERKDFTPWGTDQADKIIEGYRVWGPLPGGDAPGLIAASELVPHQEQDKFRPGQVVDWVRSDGSQAAGGSYNGSEIVERLTDGTFAGQYRVRNSEGSEGIIAGEDLVLATSADTWWDGHNSGDSPNESSYSGYEDSADSPDEYPDYVYTDEVQDVPGDLLDMLTKPGQGGKIFMLDTPLKNPDAPTAEELSKGIDVSAHITDISGFSTTFTLGAWQEPEEDGVNAPSHYSEGIPGEYEVIDVIHAQGWEDNWYMGNAVKYLLRAQYKGNYAQDLRKVVKMIEWELSRTEANDE